MTAGQAAQLLRDPNRPRRSTYIELFFDVVFVFAVTRLSNSLFADLTWLGLWRVMLLLAAFWWIWVLTTWMSGRLDPDRPFVQLLIVSVMLATLVMSVAAPTAFNDQGFLFAALYLVSQVGRTVFFALALRRQGFTLGARRLALFGISATLWLAGGFANPNARLMLWSAAVILDFITAEFRLPRYEEHGHGLRASADHLAERFHQFTIITLGDKILAPSLTLTTYPFEAKRILALVVSFWTTVLLWRIYFYRAGELMPAGIAASRNPARYGRTLSHLHLIMIAGLVLSAVGEDILVSNPTRPNSVAWVATIVGGPVVFLLGRLSLDKLTFNHIRWPRTAGVLVLAAAVPVLVWLPPVLVTTTVNIILTGIVIADVIVWRRHPRTPSPAQ